MYYNNKTDTEDTIAAISTPVGEGGIGIVRLSGRDAFKIAEEIFVPAKRDTNYPQSHRLYYGYMKNEKGESIDEVLLSFMKAPGTYTRENIVEVNCHSGVVALKTILQMILGKGARLAGPGEFTKRAYLNGRIDLSQAESILNMITARSEKALKNAAKIIKGELSEEINNLRHIIIGIVAHIEATLDFPGEEIEDIDKESLSNNIKEVIEKIKSLYKSAEKGSVFQDGLNVSIVGKPNVGKSSLLNSILKKQRAIVTEIPGTTRDILEEQINLKGVPVCLIDTAGIRKTVDPVEKAGVNLSREAIKASDLVLFMLDASSGLGEEDREILKIINEEQIKFIVVVNKIDLINNISDECLKENINSKDIIKISVKAGTGLDKLEEIIASSVEGELSDSEGLMISNIRHKEALFQAGRLMEQALNGLEKTTIDMITVDLKQAEERLGEISGETASEDLLDRIFARFCIGK